LFFSPSSSVLFVGNAAFDDIAPVEVSGGGTLFTLQLRATQEGIATLGVVNDVDFAWYDAALSQRSDLSFALFQVAPAQVEVTSASIPEPGTLLLLGTGLAALHRYRARRQQR
jgi:hypothetical protein